MRTAVFLSLFLLFSQNLWSQEQAPKVIIDGEEKAESPVDRFSVFKTEWVDQEKINSPTRPTLADIVKDQVGVDAQVYCANCGAKRLTINGLRGEHTSILVDGIPLHSAVSSFYGVDNVPANGVEEINVMRGAGASLTNPEAIGGTLNIRTIDPLNAKSSYLTSVGIDDSATAKSNNHQVMYVTTGEEKNWGLAVGSQYSKTETWDEDNNNVAELPQRENFSGLVKTRFLLGNKNDFTARVGYSQLEILGGASDPRKPNQVRPLAAREQDFVNGSVEEDFIGDPIQITDWINLKRFETALTGSHYISDATAIEWKLGQARQSQDAIYQHGFDYANIDNMFVGDAQIKYAMNESNIFTGGLFFKDQRLRSNSAVMFNPGGLGLRKDDFDYSSYAAYGQYSLALGDWMELDFAVRADRVSINWRDLTNEVSETVLAPRFQLLQNFTDHFSQRFSYGLGYRAPLTFFESQHGNQESGYEVDITSLEKAHSFVYSLSLNEPDYYVTGSAHYTVVENLAYGFEEFQQPIRYRNSFENFEIYVYDILLGYKPADWWLIETSIEFFDYDDLYKRRLPTAAIEKRIQLKSEINYNSWTHLLRATMVGGRDLSRYSSYDDHYINRNQGAEPVLDPNLQLKDQNSPTFFTVDTSIGYQYNEALVFTFAVNNVFDYTQASAGDTPATWHWHFDHAHYDGLHVWGPNQGRQFVFSLSGQF